MTDKQTKINQQEQIKRELRESEARFRAIVENSQSGILIVNNNFEFTYVNDMLCQILDSSQKEIIGSDFRSVLDEESKKIVADRYIRRQKGEAVPPRYEFSIIRKDGEKRHVEISMSTIHDAQGQPLSIGQILDITERKQAEEKLLRLSSAVEQAGDGIAITDMEGNTLFVNRAWADMHGYTVEEITGKHLAMFHTKEQLQNEVAPFNELVMKNGSNAGEVGHLRKDGNTFPTLMTTTIRKDAAGNPVGLIGTARDITERKQAEKEIQESEERFRALFNSSNDAIMTLAPPTWKFTSGNPAILNIFKVESEKEFTSLGPGDVSPEKQPDGRPSSELAQKMIQTAMEEGSGFFNWTHKRMDGEEFPATVLLTRVDLTNTSFLQATVRDITEQAQMEQYIRKTMERRGEQLQITTEIAQNISAAPGLEEIYERVVTLVKERFGYYHTQIFRHDPEKNAMVVIKGYGKAGQTMLSAGHNLPYGKGVVGTAAATGKPVLASDVTEDPNWVPHPALPETKGELAIPIKWQKEILGVLDVQSNEANALTEEDQMVLLGLAGQIANAIVNTRLFEQVEIRIRREQILREITNRVRGFTNPDTVIQSAVRQLGETLGRPTFIRLGSAKELSQPPANKNGNDLTPQNGGE